MPTLVLGSTSTYDGASKTAAELATVLTGVTESGGNLVLGLNGKVSFDNSSEVVGDAGVTKNLANELVVSTNTQELVVGSSIFPRVGVFKNDVTINSGVYVWSDSTGTPALDIQTEGVTVNNSGYVIGCGGSGGFNSTAGSSGGAGLRVTVTGCSIINASGAYIAGGGGGGGSYRAGGGGGAGGGTGGGPDGAGGGLNSAGANGGTGGNGAGGSGGGSGGGGGWGYPDQGGGGGGGRILPGTGGQGAIPVSTQFGGDGGSGGSAGSDTNGDASAGGGGGGWGASGGRQALLKGGAGGSGGAAIDDTGNTYTLTNNGTIYGAT